MRVASTLRVLRALAASVALAQAAHGAALDEAPPARARRAAVGWAIGNGLGWLGLDGAVLLSPRVAVELQLAYARRANVDETAYAVAPIVRAYRDAERSTFYAAAGTSLVRMTKPSPQGVVPTASDPHVTYLSYAFFGSLGREWRWPSGARILLGGGIGWVPTQSYMEGGRRYPVARYLGANLELGVRYAF